MSHPALSRIPALGVVMVLLAVVLLSSIPSLGQNVTQNPPVFRNDAASTIGGIRPSTMIADSDLAFIRGDGNVLFDLNYRCIDEPAQPGQSPFPYDNPALDGCALGDDGGLGSGRVVTVFYNVTGSVPATDGPSFDLGAPAGSSATSPHNLQFEANNDFSGDEVVDGQAVQLRIRVRADVSSANTDGACSGGIAAGVYTCFDPVDTTGANVYNLRFDTSEPQFILNDPANANAFQLDRNEWYLYSNDNLSGLLPTMIVTVVDNTTGAPIDADFTEFYRGSTDNRTTPLWDATVIGDGHSIIYTYDYTDEGGESFADNTSTELNLRFRDAVRHSINTRGDADLGFFVVMDITPPVLEDTSWLRQHGVDSEQGTGETPEEGLVKLGGHVAVRVNATDLSADQDTPEEFLNVQVRLETGTLSSPPQRLPWNETLDSYYSENVTVPTTWASGVTRANVTVTDPVGLVDGFVIDGNVSVDVDLPVVTPLGPLDDTQAEGFQSVATIPFRVRAEDPGDSDDWDGPNTEDTDNLGIRLDGVRVHYKVGADGPVNTVRLSAVAAANTFQATRTFNPEDEIFYYISATDIAGNVERYPAASDPHITVNDTANEGRFLRLQIDQQGPVIEEARDLNYVGGGPHEFVFLMSDSGIGLDKSTPRLHWRLAGGGTFREVALNEETIALENATGVIADTKVFRATIPTQEDGAEIQWYATARDRLENTGTLGTSTSPHNSIVDVVPPTVTVSAPATSDVARFNITWQGTDAGSGIKDYTLQFRVGTNWYTVPTRERTAQTSYEVCAATDTTYNFRVSARDNADNTREFPQQPDASTQVDAPVSCAQAPELTVSQPASGATLSGSTTVRYLAASTSFPDSLRISLGAAGQSIASGLENTGEATWNTAATGATDLCLPDGTYTLRVSASDANGLQTTADVPSLVLQNSITNCNDRDNDGLLDEWEFLHFGNLDAAANDDPDGDGFTNLQELQAGTDPQDSASRPSGSGGGPGDGDDDGWDNMYLLVALGFVAVLGTFVAGMTRRW